MLEKEVDSLESELKSSRVETSRYKNKDKSICSLQKQLNELKDQLSTAEKIESKRIEEKSKKTMSSNTSSYAYKSMEDKPHSQVEEMEKLLCEKDKIIISLKNELLETKAEYNVKIEQAQNEIESLKDQLKMGKRNNISEENNTKVMEKIRKQIAMEKKEIARLTEENSKLFQDRIQYEKIANRRKQSHY